MFKAHCVENKGQDKKKVTIFRNIHFILNIYFLNYSESQEKYCHVTIAVNYYNLLYSIKRHYFHFNIQFQKKREKSMLLYNRINRRDKKFHQASTRGQPSTKSRKARRLTACACAALINGLTLD